MSLTSTHNSFFPSITHAHKRSAVLTIILLFFTIQIGAQEFTSTSVYRAQQIDMSATPGAQVDGYQQYHSTIYEPFSSSTPSYGGSNNDQSSGMGGRKNTINTGGFGTESDPNTSTESPIGEPWILLAFAAMAAVVITLRKKQTA